MKKLLLSAVSLFCAFGVQAQYYYPNGNITTPTWFFNSVTSDNGDYYNNKTGKSGDAIRDAGLNFLTQSCSDAYDGAFEIFVNTGDSVYTEAGSPDTTGSIITLEEQLIDGLYVSKSYYFSTTEPMVRAAFKIRNATASAKAAKIGILTNFGSDEDTQLDSSSTDGTIPTNADRWTITSDGNGGNSDPVNTFVRFGPGAVNSSPFYGYVPTIDNDGDDFLDTFAISVPANSYALILQFNRMDTTIAAAKANIDKFNSKASLLSAGYLTGLSATDLANVVNWDFSVNTAVQNTTDVSNQVSIYPVPTSQNLTISLSNAFAGQTTIQVKDMTGMTFLSKEISKSGGTSYETLDVSVLEPGMYIVEIKNNEKVAYKKLIKN